MGLMDFLKKKSDSGMGIGAEGESLNFNANSLGADKTGLPQSNFGGEYQLDQHDEPNHSMDMGMSGMHSASSSFGQSSMGMQQPAMQGSNMERDMQMISLKLDAIKSELDAMSQRLRNLESIAEREQMKASPQKKWY